MPKYNRRRNMATTKKTAAKPAEKAPAKKAPVKETKVVTKTEKTVKAEKAPAKAPAKASTKAPAKVEKAPAKAPAKKVAVEFVADCPLATTVSVAGSFNDWTADKDVLKKDKKSGLWKGKISLLPGSYEYKFVCDGKNWDEGPNKIVNV